MTSKRKLLSVLVAAGFLIALTSCSKEKEVAKSDLPDLTKQTRSFVIVEETKIHAGPGFQFKPIATVRSGTKVDIVGRDGEWLLVTSKRGNPPGYIEAIAARPAKDGREREPAPTTAAGAYKLLANTEVREGPGLHYKSVAKVPKGIKINVTAEEEGWLRVESKHGKPPGYVDRNYAEPMGFK